MVKIGSVVFELKWERLLGKSYCDGQKWTIFVHLAYWRSETDWNITILISAVNRQSFLYILWKFG